MNGNWPYSDDDFLILGETGLVAIADGWYLDIHAEEIIDPDGNRFKRDGTPIDE